MVGGIPIPEIDSSGMFAIRSEIDNGARMRHDGVMSKKLTKKQLERRAARRSMKAQRMRDHEKRVHDKRASRRTVHGPSWPRVVPQKPGARTRRRQRRNGAHLRVGGR